MPLLIESRDSKISDTSFISDSIVFSVEISVCLSVLLSVCLSVETPSFPVETLKFNRFNPSISCGTVE